VKPRRGESIVFSWIAFKSKSHRDRVNAKVVADPRLAAMMKPGAMPFDVKRMAYGASACWWAPDGTGGAYPPETHSGGTIRLAIPG